MKVTLIWGWPTKVGGVMATRVPKCNDEGWMTMGNDGQVTKRGWWGVMEFFFKNDGQVMRNDEGQWRDNKGWQGLQGTLFVCLGA